MLFTRRAALALWIVTYGIVRIGAGAEPTTHGRALAASAAVDWRIEITNQSDADQEMFYFFRHGFPDHVCTI